MSEGSSNVKAQPDLPGEQKQVPQRDRDHHGGEQAGLV